VMSAAEIEAVNRLLFTNVVVRGLPFQLTTEPGAKPDGTKPVPFTVNVNAPLPGAALVGTRGWLINGTGFGGT